MPTITDWLMVAITGVYVVATVFICWANIKSANASKSQLEESKRQYEDTKRLSMMPYLQAETFDGPVDYKLQLALKDDDLDGEKHILQIRIVNIGNGTAKDIRFKWNNFTKSHDKGNFPIRALQSGNGKSILVSFAWPKIIADCTFASFDLTYEDMLENSYMQRLLFGFEQKQTRLVLKSYVMCPPCVVNKESSNA